MHLSLHIAQGDAGRVAGKQSTSNDASLNRCVRPAIAARAYYRTRSAAANYRYVKARRETHHHLPALDKQPITESPSMRSLLSQNITTPVAFKVTCCSRRFQLWNRQASIITNLTALARSHRRRRLPRV
jgi:uncharacterized protein VirK/YbjX